MLHFTDIVSLYQKYEWKSTMFADFHTKRHGQQPTYINILTTICDALANLSVFFALCGGTSERHDGELDFFGVSVHEGAHYPAGVL